MTMADPPFTQELDNLIAQCKIRIEQQRIHAKELSGDPPQQKHARAERCRHRRSREITGPKKAFY